MRARCQYCRIVDGCTNWTNCACPDCEFQPAFCQTVKRDCHSLWHDPKFDEARDIWFTKQRKQSDGQSIIQPKLDQAQSSGQQFADSLMEASPTATTKR